jgi:hypothetical protein
MTELNGAGPAPAVTGSEARKIVGTGKRDGQSSKPSSPKTQSAIRTEDAELLAKINEAVAVANEAETKVTTAQAELVSRSKTVGLLLLEAKKLHPSVMDFEAFLRKVQGLKLSRAYDCMRVAGGRTTDEEIRKAARDRVEKHRKKKKLPGPTPTPEPQKLSVTKPDVTETAEIDERKAPDLDLSAKERAAKASARCLAEFTIACRMWLPQITVEADRQKARLLVSELTSSKPKAKAA